MLLKKITILMFICFSINAQEKKYILNTIAFYNVENLFDTVDDPNNYWDEIRTPNGKDKWTNEIYNKKIFNLSEVIPNIGYEYTNSAPAIIGLCEIENRRVLVDLIRTGKMKKHNYGIIHFDSKDERGVDVALLYDKKIFKPIRSKTYQVKLFDKNGLRDYTRDQLIVEGYFYNEKIYFIVNHWPTRRGGQIASEPNRIKSGLLNKRIIDSIKEIDINSKIINMGDFNDDPKDKSVKLALKTSNSKTKIKSGQLYNPMEILHKKGFGSYKYRGKWNMLDQFLISESLLRDGNLKFLKSGVFNKKYLINPSGKYKGYPFKSFAQGKFLNGYSDHLPIFLILAKEINSF